MPLSQVLAALRRHRMRPPAVASSAHGFRFHPQKVWGFAGVRGEAELSGGRLDQLSLRGPDHERGAQAAEQARALVQRVSREVKGQPQVKREGPHVDYTWRLAKSLLVVQLVKNNDSFYVRLVLSHAGHWR